MSLPAFDPAEIAPHLRRPEGSRGREVGEMMVIHTAPMNAFTLEQMDIRPTDRVLEIGFGPGESIAEAARLTPQGFVAGIDHSEEMLRMAEDRNRKAVLQEQVELTLGTAAEMPYRDDAFDKAFAVNVLHFWPDARAELSETLRVLAPGGRAVFFLTHPGSWPPGLGGTGVFIAREAEDVAQLLREAGFRDVEIRWMTWEGGKGFAVIGFKEAV